MRPNTFALLPAPHMIRFWLSERRIRPSGQRVWEDGQNAMAITCVTLPRSVWEVRRAGADHRRWRAAGGGRVAAQTYGRSASITLELTQYMFPGPSGTCLPYRLEGRLLLKNRYFPSGLT